LKINVNLEDVNQIRKFLANDSGQQTSDDISPEKQ